MSGKNQSDVSPDDSASEFLPSWLAENIKESKVARQRTEVEVKYALPKRRALEVVDQGGFTRNDIEQIYLPRAVWLKVAGIALVEDIDSFDEWRIRRSGCVFFITGKASKSRLIRREHERSISPDEFVSIKELCRENGEFWSIRKIRYSARTEIANGPASLEFDIYVEVCGQEVDLDFAICEIEVETPQVAHALRAGRLLAPDYTFLRYSIEITTLPKFSNRLLAEHGFPVATYAELLALLRRDLVHEVSKRVQAADNDELRILRSDLLAVVEAPPRVDLHNDKNQFRRTRGALTDMAFAIEDSLGRPSGAPGSLAKLDAAGRGWIRDFQVIISANPYLRLFTKPQVFRPGLGNTNTTTRGAHTQDVTACSMLLCRQLGLNADLVAAVAALHDIGHPAGGHVGEEMLEALSGRAFRHHMFSLSLADIFKLDLLREVQVGAFYHKSGGRKLQAPARRPQEYGVVRIADKICYTPWDFFDAIMNGFLTEGEVGSDLFDILGRSAIEWIHNFVEAVVKESAEKYYVSFSPESGAVYDAFVQARKIIFEKVHTRIRWDFLKTQYNLAYSFVRESFPDIDPVPVVAYMTDHELERVALMAESRPVGSTATVSMFEDAGLGFTEIIGRLREIGDRKGVVYYSSVRGVDGLS